jgi:CrcB protein
MTTSERPAAAWSPDTAALSLIAVGGGLGSLLRYGLSSVWTTPAGEIPRATLAINLLGSLLLGALIVGVTEIWRPHRLVRPALGTGLLGGFTTFSTFAVETRGLAADHAPFAMLGYLAVSIVGGLGAALLGMAVMRRLEPRLSIGPLHSTVDPLDPDQP